MSKTSFLFGVIDDYWLTVHCLWKIIREMWKFMITLLNRKKNWNPLFQTGDVVYGEGKLRNLGMVFKSSFKCFKNKKINFIQAFLKLESLVYKNIYILFHLILYRNCVEGGGVCILDFFVSI
jgi:hypothetical protein